MADQRFWITARLDEDGLYVALSGAQTILEEDDNYRTREAVAQINLSDEAALRSARAALVPMTRLVDRTTIEDRRLAAIPAPGELLAALGEELSKVLEAYLPALTNFTRRMARTAEVAALMNDLEGDDNTDAINAAITSGGLTARKGVPE